MKNLNRQSKVFLNMFNLRYPIIQAGMDGAAGPSLVSAVTNAGGLGILPLGFRAPDAALAQIKEVQSNANGPFIANFVLNFPSLSYKTAINAGVRAILFSWGLPDAYMLDQLRTAGVLMGIQVSGGIGAEKALALNPDFLVVQGVEAGGHVQGNKPLSVALAEVLAIANNIPVVAAGGIANGADIYKYLNLGAAAVILGTRFVATKESGAHPVYKQEIVNTKSASDTVLTNCLNKVWPNATHRLLRSNTTFKMWESNGRPPGPVYVNNGTLLGNRPGEYDIVALDGDGTTTWERYVDVVPVESMDQCDVNALGTFAGEGVGEINDIPSVADLMMSLSREFNACG